MKRKDTVTNGHDLFQIIDTDGDEAWVKVIWGAKWRIGERLTFKKSSLTVMEQAA